MNFDKEAKSEFFLLLGGGGVGGGTETKRVCQAVSKEINYIKGQLSTRGRACGRINISKYLNNFLSTNPTTFILNSLVSKF